MARRHRYGNPDGNQQGIFDFAAKRLGAEVRNTTAVGRGFPDGVIGWHGLTVLAEVKQPGGKLRKSQEDFVRVWRGGPVLTVDSGESLLTQLLALDIRTPPVRGLPLPMPVDQAITKAATAIEAAQKIKAQGLFGLTSAGYILETRAALEDLVRSVLTWQAER